MYTYTCPKEEHKDVAHLIHTSVDICMYLYIHVHVFICTCTYTYLHVYIYMPYTGTQRYGAFNACYGVATISRLLKSIGLFCKRAL